MTQSNMFLKKIKKMQNNLHKEGKEAHYTSGDEVNIYSKFDYYVTS